MKDFNPACPQAFYGCCFLESVFKEESAPDVKPETKERKPKKQQRESRW
jgi:hypothetical protein